MNSPHSQDVVFHAFAAQPVARVRYSVAVAQLQPCLADGLTALWRHLREHDMQPDGPPYVRYHSFDEIQTDIEIGVPTQAPAPPDRQISTVHLPGGPAISAWHAGAQDRPADAYGRLRTWMDVLGLVVRSRAERLRTRRYALGQPPSARKEASSAHVQTAGPDDRRRLHGRPGR